MIANLSNTLFEAAHNFKIPTQLDLVSSNILLIISSVTLIITCFGFIFNKNLLSSVITLSIFSLFIAIYYLLLDAPDVAMTEVALGACLSSCVFLNVLSATGQQEVEVKTSKLKIFLAIILCFSLASCLIFMSGNLPEFGAENSPLQQGASRYYLENTHKDIGLPSVVATILGSYRGFDTFGETIVILIAGLAVLLIKNIKKENNA